MELSANKGIYARPSGALLPDKVSFEALHVVVGSRGGIEERDFVGSDDAAGIVDRPRLQISRHPDGQQVPERCPNLRFAPIGHSRAIDKVAYGDPAVLRRIKVAGARADCLIGLFAYGHGLKGEPLPVERVCGPAQVRFGFDRIVPAIIPDFSDSGSSVLGL